MPWLPVDAGSFWEWQRSAQSLAQMAFVSPFQGYNVSGEGGKLPEVMIRGMVLAQFLFSAWRAADVGTRVYS